MMQFAVNAAAVCAFCLLHFTALIDAQPDHRAQLPKHGQLPALPSHYRQEVLRSNRNTAYLGDACEEHSDCAIENSYCAAQMTILQVTQKFCSCMDGYDSMSGGCSKSNTTTKIASDSIALTETKLDASLMLPPPPVRNTTTFPKLTTHTDRRDFASQIMAAPLVQAAYLQPGLLNFQGREDLKELLISNTKNLHGPPPKLDRYNGSLVATERPIYTAGETPPEWAYWLHEPSSTTAPVTRPMRVLAEPREQRKPAALMDILRPPVFHAPTPAVSAQRWKVPAEWAYQTAQEQVYQTAQSEQINSNLQSLESIAMALKSAGILTQVEQPTTAETTVATLTPAVTLDYKTFWEAYIKELAQKYFKESSDSTVATTATTPESAELQTTVTTETTKTCQTTPKITVSPRTMTEIKLRSTGTTTPMTTTKTTLPPTTSVEKVEEPTETEPATEQSQSQLIDEILSFLETLEKSGTIQMAPQTTTAKPASTVSMENFEKRLEIIAERVFQKLLQQQQQTSPPVVEELVRTESTTRRSFYYIRGDAEKRRQTKPPPQILIRAG